MKIWVSCRLKFDRYPRLSALGNPHEEIFKLRLSAVGKNLPTRALVGSNQIEFHWTFRPVLYHFHLVREELAIREHRNPNESRTRRFFWGLRRILILSKNGNNPFRGLISGKVGYLQIPEGIDHKPILLEPLHDLLIFRSVGKFGICLPEVDNFLDVKMSRSINTKKAIVLCEVRFSKKGRKARLPRKINLKNLSSIQELCILNSCLQGEIQLPSFLHLLGCREKLHAMTSIAASQITCIDQKLNQEFGIENVYIEKAIIMAGLVLERSSNDYILYEPSTLPVMGLNSSWPRSIWQYAESEMIGVAPYLSVEELTAVHVISCVENFHHFIEDTLPQVIVHLDEYRNMPVLMNGGLDSTMKQILDQLLPSQWSEIAPSTLYYGSKLYCSLFRSERGRLSSGESQKPSREIVELVSRGRSLLLGERKESKQDLKIVAARRAGLHRPLINRAEVYRNLEQLGFNLVYFEDLDLQQRIELLARTSIMVGESGAALANAYFLGEGAKFIEIRHPEMIHSNEQSLIEQVTGLNVHLYKGATSTSADKTIFGKDAYRIPCRNFTSWLEKVY